MTVYNAWPVRVVATVTALNSAGQLVDAVPVRAAIAGETNTIGQPIDPIATVLSDLGTPVRVVVGKTATNSAGVPIDTVAVTGEAVA